MIPAEDTLILEYRGGIVEELPRPQFGLDSSHEEDRARMLEIFLGARTRHDGPHALSGLLRSKSQAGRAK